MTRLEVLLAELYTDHGIDLIRTTAGMSKEVEEKITELAEELVKLLQGGNSRSSKEASRRTQSTVW